MDEVINIEEKALEYGISKKYKFQSIKDTNLQKTSLLEADLPEHLRGDFQSINTDRNPKYEQDLQKSYFAQFKTTISFVISDLRKKQQQFKIGVITVFMVVAFTTFLSAFINSTPSLFIMISQANGGDYDLQVTSISPSEYMVKGNKNFYLDGLFFSMEDFEFEEPSNETKKEKEGISPTISNYDTSPLVNFTKLKEELKFNPEVEGVYPRWLTLAKVSSPYDNSELETASFVTYGDSKLERDLNVADGFPTTLLGKDDAIASQSLLQIFDLKVKDQLQIKYDFLSFLPSEFNTIKEIIFDYEPANEEEPSKGQLFMLLLSLNPFITFGTLKTYALFTYGFETYFFLNDLTEILEIQDYELVADRIDEAFRSLKKEDFILQKNYTVVEEVTMLYGKWSRALGNAIFLDSTYLKDFILDELHQNAKRYMSRNRFDYNTYMMMNELFENLKAQYQNLSISDYSLSVNVQFKNRMEKYVKDNGDGMLDSINSIYQSQLLFETSTAFPTIMQKTENMEMVKIMLSNVFINITLFIFFISFILYYSLVKSDIEERTYDYAMLRTLGYENHGLISLLSLRTLIFSCPGVLVGFAIMLFILVAVKLIIFSYVQFKLYTDIDFFTIFSGIFMGILVPLLANIVPISELIGYSLRDSLDVYRNKVNLLQVRMMRLENLGISISQIIIGVCFALFGFTTYYFIPLSFILGDLNLFFFLILSILFFMILGLSFIVQALVPTCENIILSIIMIFKTSDQKLKPIIKKYLQSHSARNAKTSMVFTITVTFLIYAGTSFTQIEYILQSLTKAYMGADLALIRANELSDQIALNEVALRSFLDQNSIINGGIVTSYCFLPQHAGEIIKNRQGQELKAGFGMKALNFYNIKLYSLEENHIEVHTPEFYFPTEIWQEAKSITNKTYTDDQVLSMLYDLAPTSYYKATSDPFGIASNGRLKDDLIDSTIINVVIPEAFRGVFPIKVGEFAMICLGSNGGITFNQNDCKLKYKARVIGTIKRMPTIWDVSGYKPAVYLGLACFVSQDQLKYMIDQYLELDQDAKEVYQERMQGQSTGSTYGIPKKRLSVQLQKNATDQQVNKLLNLIIKEAGEYNVYGFSARQFYIDLDNGLLIMFIASSLISLILFILTFFQLIVTISSNLRDNEWELGVLRAIGVKKSDLIKITLYEAISSISASAILGLIIGIISSIQMTALFFMFNELPFTLNLSYMSILFMFVITGVIIIVGTYIGTKSINQKQITTILKGLS